MMQDILAIATLLGGITALWFIYDKAASVYRGTTGRMGRDESGEEVAANNVPDLVSPAPPAPPAVFVIVGVNNTVTLEITDDGNPGQITITGIEGKYVYQVQSSTAIHIKFRGSNNTLWLPSSFNGALQIDDVGLGNEVRRQVVPSWIGHMLGTHPK